MTTMRLSTLAILLLVVLSFFHSTAAARRLPTAAVHQESDGGVKAAADLADGMAVLEEGINGEEEEEAGCEEGNEECMQRRLLRDAHLDYIYTQHKGKP